MKPLSRLSLTLPVLFFAAHLFAQGSAPNNTLRGRVLYQSSGNKPAKGVRIKETDSNGDYSKDNGDYRLVFQTKRNGATLALEVGADTREGKKIELVNEKELKAAKLPAGADELLDIIVCPAGQRDIAAQKYYRILRTTADRELERKKKEVEDLLAQKEKDYQRISDLFAQLDVMQADLDSAKIREQAFSIASINLDRASQLVKDAVRKIDEENDVEGALKILSAEALDTAYEHASAVKKQGQQIIKKADAEIQQVIDGYEFKISLLEPQFRYGEMAECFENIVKIYEREDYDKGRLANNLTSAAACLEKNGDYNKALEYEMKALSFLEKNPFADDSDWAISYQYMAVIYFLLGEYEKALEFYMKTLSILQKIRPADHPDLALLYNNLAENYSKLGDYQKALEYGMQALYIREKVLSTNHPDLAMSYNNVAQIYGQFGNYQKQLEYNLKSLSILEKTLPANHPDLAMSYQYMSSALNNLGDDQKALEFNLKASTIWEKVLPADHPNLAMSYNNLALIYSSLSDYQKAQEFNLKALAIWEKVLPADHPDLAVSYNNIAMSYEDHGDLQKALEFILKALAIWEKALPVDHPDVAAAYNNLAVIYSSLGDYQKALEFNQKTLSILEKILPADHPNLATVYSNVGGAYRDIGNYEKGIEYSQKAISLGEASNPKHRILNRFYTGLGITYAKARQYSEAKAALEKSESLKQEWRVYRGWALYYALQKKKKLALESLQKAVTLGFKDLKWLETEPDLKNIRKEKGYKDLVEQLKKQ